MSALDLDDIRTNAKTLLDIDDDLFISSAQQIALANIANREVYKMICRAAPDMFLEPVEQETWPSGTESLDITTVLGAEPYQIISIMETPNSGAISDSNRPWNWSPMDYRDRARWSYGSMRNRLDSDNERKYNTRYSLQGNLLFATPIPTSDRFLHISWIPQVTALSSGGNEVLDGKAEQFGDAVCYRLAVLMNSKQEHQNSSVDNLWFEAQQQIKALSRRQIQRSPRVRSRGRY